MDFFWRAVEYYGLAGTGGLLAILMLGLFIGYAAKSYAQFPLLSDRQRRYDEFWRTLPASKAHGYQGALLWDEWLSTLHWLWPWRRIYFISRLILVLKHEDNARSEILFRSKENPNVDSLDDTIRAFSLWIKTAQAHDIPAVYRSGHDFHILTHTQMTELDADPAAFLARFQKSIRKNKPLA